MIGKTLAGKESRLQPPWGLALESGVAVGSREMSRWAAQVGEIRASGENVPFSITHDASFLSLWASAVHTVGPHVCCFPG